MKTKHLSRCGMERFLACAQSVVAGLLTSWLVEFSTLIHQKLSDTNKESAKQFQVTMWKKTQSTLNIVCTPVAGFLVVFLYLFVFQTNIKAQNSEAARCSLTRSHTL